MNTDLQNLESAIANSLNGLNATQTQLSPAARQDAWNIQQIIEHLLLTYALTETAVSVRLEKRKPTRAKSSLKQRLSQYFVFRLGYFPHGRKAPEGVTPPAPGHPLSGVELTQAVAEHLARLDMLFDEAGLLFGPGQCINHQVLGPLSIPEWRRFQLRHGIHHVKQVVAIRKAHNL